MWWGVGGRSVLLNTLLDHGLDVDQRKVRQREAAKGLAWRYQLERTFSICWRGRKWVSHCCCELARYLVKETKSAFSLLWHIQLIMMS
jgi:hypothetical protein